MRSLRDARGDPERGPIASIAIRHKARVLRNLPESTEVATGIALVAFREFLETQIPISERALRAAESNDPSAARNVLTDFDYSRRPAVLRELLDALNQSAAALGTADGGDSVFGRIPDLREAHRIRDAEVDLVEGYIAFWECEGRRH